MAELIFNYLTILGSSILVPIAFLRIVADIFRNYVFDMRG